MDGRRSEGCYHERKEERGVLLCGRKSEGGCYVGGRARGAFMDGRNSEGAFMFWQQEHLVTLSVDS